MRLFDVRLFGHGRLNREYGAFIALDKVDLSAS